MMLTQLLVPIAVSTVALFFMSFLSWMLLKLHERDWSKLANEPEFLDFVRGCRLENGRSYMFPKCDDHKEMNSPEFRQKLERGPRGIITQFHPIGMGRNLVITVVIFFVVSLTLAYVSTLAFAPGEPRGTIFQFFAITGLLTFLTAIVQHAVWFQIRVVGHVIESVLYASILGGVFAYFWPAV